MLAVSVSEGLEAEEEKGDPRLTPMRPTEEEEEEGRTAMDTAVVTKKRYRKMTLQIQLGRLSLDVSLPFLSLSF